MKTKIKTEIFDEFEKKHPSKHPIKICLECGISLTTYKKAKNNDMNVDFFELSKLIDYMGVKVEDIAYFEPENEEDREYLNRIEKIKYLKENGVIIFKRKPTEFPTV